MSKLKRELLKIILGILIVIYLAIESLNTVVYNKELMVKEMKKQSTYNNLDVDSETVDKALELTLDYIFNRAEDLSLEVHPNKKDNTAYVIIDGQEYRYKTEFDQEEYFNTIEKSHLEDVQELFNMLSFIHAIALISILAILINLVSNKETKLTKTIISSIITNLAFIVAISMFMLNFDKLWVEMHKIIFDNNNWILSLNTSRLANMLYGDFFNSISTHIIIKYAISTLILYTVIIVYTVIKRRIACRYQETK